MKNLNALKVTPHDAESLLQIELDHGRANEMGSAEIADWTAIAQVLESGRFRSVVTYSRRTSRQGTPIFIAGANVTERAGWESERVQAHVRGQRALLLRLRAAPVFHIAVVHGVALGWGTEFLLACDYRIATPGARLGLPETGLGIVPGAGGTADLVSSVGLPMALLLGMTGEQLGAGDALRIGLVQELAADVDAGLSRALDLARLVRRRSPTAVAAFKQSVLRSIGQPPDARIALEASAYDHCVETGEAARGRANFKAILAGEEVEWGPLQLLP